MKTLIPTDGMQAMTPIILPTDKVAEIIRRSLSGMDPCDVVIELIDEVFVDDVVRFHKQLAFTKLRDESITFDWYREHFLDAEIDKTAIGESVEHLDDFLELLESLTDADISVNLSLAWSGVTVHLDLNEAMVVINALAVRRAGRRGGVWSAVGKQLEAPLMETMCRVLEVDPRHYIGSLSDDDSVREVDYYLLPPDGSRARCEVKLMGAGNPESSDGPIARGSRVFVASTLSEQNKVVLDSYNILWTQLQTPNGFLRFQDTLSELGIPHTRLNENEDHADRIERAIRATLDA